MSKLYKDRRPALDPSKYGIAIDRRELVDLFAANFAEQYKNNWTIDELVLHPMEAIRFCDYVRRANGYDELPDDVILRALMQRRKTGRSFVTAKRERYIEPFDPNCARCHLCGLKYGGHRWIEALVPDEVWLRIKPASEIEPILCIQCMAAMCVELGLINVPLTLSGGPFVLAPPTNEETHDPN